MLKPVGHMFEAVVLVVLTLWLSSRWRTCRCSEISDSGLVFEIQGSLHTLDVPVLGIGPRCRSEKTTSSRIRRHYCGNRDIIAVE